MKLYYIYLFRAAEANEIGPVLVSKTIEAKNKAQAKIAAKNIAAQQNYRLLEIKEKS
ncbi:MAG: hypothetical protein AB1478_02785 [Nitrospirota bacterium]